MISLLDKAIAFALKAHAGQIRKTGDNIPFIAHPFAVAMSLQAMGCEEKVVIAGLLHDVVEDTQITMPELEREFGKEIAGIVAYCTEPKGRWEVRKQFLIQSLRHAPLESKLLAATDKYHNLTHMLHALEKQGTQMWQQFSRGPEQQAWYYRSVLTSILTNIDTPERYPVFGQLQQTINLLFADIPG